MILILKTKGCTLKNIFCSKLNKLLGKDKYGILYVKLSIVCLHYSFQQNESYLYGKLYHAECFINLERLVISLCFSGETKYLL